MVFPRFWESLDKHQLPASDQQLKFSSASTSPSSPPPMITPTIRPHPDSPFSHDRSSAIARSTLGTLFEEHTPELKRRSLDDYLLLKVIGKGCMGKVLIGKEKSSNKIYAVKSISKKWVLSHGKQEVEHIMAEQRILASLSRIQHPFLIRLNCSFQSVDNLFLVMEFVGGGDLATQLDLFSRFDLERSRLYCAEIVSGILELHRLGIIYRDLKPENVLLCADGHIKLTDFGLSKQFKISTRLVHDHDECVGGSDCACLRTKTFCGTAEYLAPEILMSQSYSFEVDWWSLGTFLYEMITGITPFWAENHHDMYERVLRDSLEFPPDLQDGPTINFISKLLVRNPVNRLGHGDIRGLKITSHPFFASIDWNLLHEKKIKPPYKPHVQGDMDVSWFDKSFTGMSPIVSPSADVGPIATVENPQNNSESELFLGYTFLSTSAQRLMQNFGQRSTIGSKLNRRTRDRYPHGQAGSVESMAFSPMEECILEEEDGLEFNLEDL
eukprot:Partr_v1_DN26378_c0_g1_i2_m43019 putative Ribosomal protein S6 kinase